MFVRVLATPLSLQALFMVASVNSSWTYLSSSYALLLLLQIELKFHQGVTLLRSQFNSDVSESVWRLFHDEGLYHMETQSIDFQIKSMD